MTNCARARGCAGSNYPFLTQKERDNETGLDYFLARYYSSSQGRFTSPDPLAASAGTINPQSWNRYPYALNNPVKLFDPQGLSPQDPQPRPTPTPLPPDHEAGPNSIIQIFDFLFGDYYQDPGDAGAVGQAFRDPLALLINPGTVGAKYEVGVADSNLVSGLLRGASAAEMGVPSGMRLVITPTIYRELSATEGVAQETLDAALARANIEVREVSQSAMGAALRDVVPKFNKGALSPDLVKATGQISDMWILAEAKAWGLPVLTNNAADFHVNAVGGGRLAERVGVPVLKTNVVPKHLPRLSDVLKAVVRKVL